MFRKLTCLVTAAAFVSSMAPASYAQDNRFAGGDPYASRGHMQVGVYMKLPFTGGLKYHKREKLKFGAALGFTREYNTSNTMFAPRQQFTANLVDLKFDNSGFKALALSGQDILIPQDGRIVLSVDEDGKIKWGKVGLYTLAVIGGVVVLATVVILACTNDDGITDTCDGQ